MEQELNNDQLVDYVVTIKHDITSSLTTLVTAPILAMSKAGSMTDIYLSSKTLDHDRTRSLAKEVSAFFNKKWADDNLSSDVQAASILKNLQSLTSVYDKKILEVVSFYEHCLEHPEFFADSSLGKRALRAVQNSLQIKEDVLLELHKLKSKVCTDDVQLGNYNLLCLLQEVFDSMKADVRYIGFNLDTCIKTDKNLLTTHVLMNLKHNMENHAFGVSPYSQSFVWDNIVLVQFRRLESKYELTISNNGAPFKGDVEKVFEDGYYHGEKGHSGHGMHSARKYVNMLGGDIKFTVPSIENSDFKVSYVLTFPINE